MIAITGAAGFIGTNLALRYARAGHRLLLVDRDSAADRLRAHPDLAGLPFEGHLAFAERLGHGSRWIDTVIHLGAISSTRAPDDALLRRDNVDYPRRLWEACSRRQIPLYYASSAATYGDGSLGFDDRTDPADLRPLNAYARSKNDFDRWALARARDGRPTPPAWAGLKFFNVYGPHEEHKGGMASMVHQARRQAEQTGVVVLYRSGRPENPDGEPRRDFVYVGDCLDHIDWLRRHPDVSGIFNSGSGIARTFRDLTLAVLHALGRSPVIRTAPLPHALAAGYQDYTKADLTTLRGAGYRGSPTPLEAGVQQTLGDRPIPGD